jgi:hypothetical protein
LFGAKKKFICFCPVAVLLISVGRRRKGIQVLEDASQDSDAWEVQGEGRITPAERMQAG